MGWDWEYRDEDYPALAKLRRTLRSFEKRVASMNEDRERACIAAGTAWDSEHKVVLDDLELEVQRAKDACDAAVASIRMDASLKALPYPEGTVVEERKRSGTSFSAIRSDPKPTGKKGVIQIFRAGDWYPTNLSEYSAPEVGSVVVRELKKDGTPGLVVKKLAGWNSHWYKDGKLVELKEKEVSDAEV